MSCGAAEYSRMQIVLIFDTFETLLFVNICSAIRMAARHSIIFSARMCTMLKASVYSFK
jgi:hypothetical protein